jgi:hypothetical protein
MKYKELLIAGAMTLASFAAAEAAEDLSSFGLSNRRDRCGPPQNQTAGRHTCARRFSE